MNEFRMKFSAGDRKLSVALDLDPGRFNENHVLSFLKDGQLYEPDISNLMLQVVRDGDVVVDVGANCGFFSVFLGTLTGPSGRVLSFEPGDINLPRLKNHVAINGFAHVDVIEKAASAEPGEVRFYINSDDSGGNALWDVANLPSNVKSAANRQFVTVRATTVDAEIAQRKLPAPRLIKIDTEGAELQVLKGCREILTDHRTPFVITEYHPFGLVQMGTSPQELRAFMESFGYSTFALYYDGSMPRFVPPQTEIVISHIVNLLFSTPEEVGRVWKTAYHNPRKSAGAPPAN